MKLLINNEIDPLEWQQLIDASPYASFFQTKACYEFYCSLSFLEPFLIAVEENDKLVALVCGYIIADGNSIKQFFSRRAIVPGGLLLHPKVSEQAIATLLTHTNNQLIIKAIYTEIRNYFDYSAYKNTFQKAGFEYKEHLNFHVATPSVEIALKNLSTTKRRDIKLSKKEGATITDTKNETDVLAYFELLNDLYITKIKTPLFPIEFFNKIILLPECHLFAIHLNNELIGGSLCVEMPNKILYEWFVCGKDGKYKNIYPSTLATWAAIEYAAEHNFQYFDMMGAGKPDEGYGVRDFKAKFGGELVEHGRFIHINQPILYTIGKQAVKFLKKSK